MAFMERLTRARPALCSQSPRATRWVTSGGYWPLETAGGCGVEGLTLACGGGPSPPQVMLSSLITASSEAGAQPVGQAHPPAPIPQMRKLRLNRGNIANCFLLQIALGRGCSEDDCLGAGPSFLLPPSPQETPGSTHPPGLLICFLPLSGLTTSTPPSPRAPSQGCVPAPIPRWLGCEEGCSRRLGFRNGEGA